jgi:anti-sigma B factor antagonist
MADREHPRTDPMAPPPAFRMDRLEGPQGVIVLVLAGEIDLATSGRFRAVVDEAIEAGASLVADVEEVTFMDSTMLRELLRAHRDIGAAGRRFILAAPQPPVRRLLELTGTHGLFTVSDTRQDGVASA